ncbi:MAG: hypothetical protein R2909_16900 [Gemmatimonadales bacterium]
MIKQPWKLLLGLVMLFLAASPLWTGDSVDDRLQAILVLVGAGLGASVSTLHRQRGDRPLTWWNIANAAWLGSIVLTPIVASILGATATGVGVFLGAGIGWGLLTGYGLGLLVAGLGLVDASGNHRSRIDEPALKAQEPFTWDELVKLDATLVLMETRDELLVVAERCRVGERPAWLQMMKWTLLFGAASIALFALLTTFLVGASELLPFTKKQPASLLRWIVLGILCLGAFRLVETHPGVNEFLEALDSERRRWRNHLALSRRVRTRALERSHRP